VSTARQGIAPRLSGRTARHIGVVAAYVALFTWVWARPLVEDGYLAGTDLFDYYLPIFFSPLTIWSHFELSGLPAFADSQNASFYPLNLLFARLLPSWTAYIVSAYVLAATFTYAYVYGRTRSVSAAAFAGLGFGLSEALMERLDHLTIVHVLVWMPLVVLALDRLRGGWSARWVVVGAFAVANTFLAGHTQPAIYITYVTALYALIGGLATRARLAYYAAVFVLFAAGGMLSAVSSIPLLEASRETVRQSLNFGQFVSHSNTPAQMLSALLPQIAHEGREAPTYVGLAMLVLALVTVRDLRRNWVVTFWWSVAVVTILAGVGDATPVAGWLFELPFYDSFRVVARHLTIAAFAIAVLGGIGLAGLLSRPSRVAGAAAATLVAAAVGLAISAVVSAPATFPIEATVGSLEVQALMLLATAAVVVGLTWKPRSVPLVSLVLVVLAVDLLYALPYSVRWSGVQAPVIPAEAIQPSVHATAIRRLLQVGPHRLLTPEGVTVDPVVPGSFARLWEIPVAGAYGAILTPRYAALAAMGTTGAVQPQVLADDSAALDLLAVRYVLTRRAPPAENVEAHGVAWTAAPLDLAVGPRECGQKYSRRATYALPPELSVKAVLMAAALRCSEDVVGATPVGALTVVGGGGQQTMPLRAGLEIADAMVGLPELQGRARHTAAEVFERLGDGRQNYLTRIELPQPMANTRLEFTLDGTAGWLQIDRLTVVDQNGTAIPLSSADVLFSNRDRWRVAATFATSALTDRGGDEDAAGEQQMTLLENHRALPRAWLAKEVVPLDERNMLIAVQHSYLPDGRRLDPAAMALVDAGSLPPARYAAGAAEVDVKSVDDGIVRVDVASEAGGFLVLSESYYPGWRSAIDGRDAPLYRTNVALQGVAVPPGRHDVVFTFEPPSFRIGAMMSAATLAGLAVLAAAGLIRRKEAADTPPRAQTMPDTSSAT
jgi:hypothetical protein